MPIKRAPVTNGEEDCSFKQLHYYCTDNMSHACPKHSAFMHECMKPVVPFNSHPPSPPCKHTPFIPSSACIIIIRQINTTTIASVHWRHALSGDSCVAIGVLRMTQVHMLYICSGTPLFRTRTPVLGPERTALHDHDS